MDYSLALWESEVLRTMNKLSENKLNAQRAAELNDVKNEFLSSQRDTCSESQIRMYKTEVAY